VKEKLTPPPFVGYAIFTTSCTVTSFYAPLNIAEEGIYLINLELENSEYLQPGEYLLSIAFFKEVDEFDNSRPWDSYLLIDRKFRFKIIPNKKVAIDKGLVLLNTKVSAKKLEE
jgi:hypothetical protein